MVVSHSIIGANMKKARLKAGLTQEKLAERMDISSIHYGKLERGQRKASLETLVRTADALDTSPFALLQSAFFDQDAAPIPGDYTTDLYSLIRNCSEETRRLMYSICWLIAAECE